jgi:hypothetical protein
MFLASFRQQVGSGKKALLHPPPLSGNANHWTVWLRYGSIIVDGLSTAKRIIGSKQLPKNSLNQIYRYKFRPLLAVPR